MFGGGLVSDDWVWLERARTGAVLEMGLFFRPACWCSWWAQAAMDPRWIHLGDLLLHWLCAWQLARLVTALCGSRAAGGAVAACFSTLPALHEAVCWSSARCGPLAAACVCAAMAGVTAGRRTLLAIPLIAVAMASQEAAVGLSWGLPLLLAARGRGRDAARWAAVLAVITAGYMAALEATGSHQRLSGGYTAPFSLPRLLAHLGAYLGLALGREGTSGWWPLWPALGLAAAWAGVRRRRWTAVALWAWASITMFPLVRLGGPEQPRFLYVMVLPVLTAAGCGISLLRGRAFRGAVGIVAALGLVMTPQARSACRDWLTSGARVAPIVARAVGAVSPGRPVIVVNVPEWEGNAHLLRNGLFPAMRLSSGLPFVGLTIPPSQSVESCGQLLAWLALNAPPYAEDASVGAWMFVGDDLRKLTGWRDAAHADLPLAAMRDKR
jgi:hypothetical protein